MRIIPAKERSEAQCEQSLVAPDVLQKSEIWNSERANIMLKALREQVLESNLELVRQGLVICTWGNVSALDKETGYVVIKPSGVSYNTMKAKDMVIVDLNGKHIEGELNASSDLDTHLIIYRSFKGVGGVVHTHSKWATIWAQAGLPIPCAGTTQADYFYGEIPVTRRLTVEEIGGQYEVETGNVIVERFQTLDPLSHQGILVNSHGPFAWGKDPFDAVENAKVMEYVAEMAFAVHMLAPNAAPMQSELIQKHYTRKHGEHAYYGQKTHA